jgi:hypothetical protein
MTTTCDSRPRARAQWLLPCAAVLPLLAALGCGGTSIASQYDRWAAFDRYASYSIQPGPIRNEGTVVGGPNELVQDRIDTALVSQLNARGLLATTKGEADLIVTYTASEGERQELVRGRTGPEATGTYAGRAIWVQEYREAQLIIDVIDTEQQKVVWRSTARGMNQKLRDPEFIQQAVERSLAEFPRGLGQRAAPAASAGAKTTTTEKDETVGSLTEQEPGG